jgi:hypothetical protein
MQNSQQSQRIFHPILLEVCLPIKRHAPREMYTFYYVKLLTHLTKIDLN